MFEKYNINNISALTEGAIYINSNVKSIIEIGAQSSRFIKGFSSDSKANITFSMNSSCSAGTGSFLEEQASRLGIKLCEYSEYTDRATSIPRIAGRCSVFAKTDMIHHQQQGVKTEDILLGLCYSLIKNYKSNVIQRKTIEKPVIFIGGVANNKGVVKAVKEVLKLSDNDLILTKNCSSVGALGAALIANKNEMSHKFDEIVKNISSNNNKDKINSNYKPLKKFGLNDSDNNYVCKKAKNDKIEGYLGIDIGSTSTNLVLIDKDNNVLSYRYLRTRGNPKIPVKDGIASINEEYNGRLEILGMGTTGSGRMLIGKKLEVDLIVNEITAQAKGAINFDNEVDTIFEIGGQDSKYIHIKDGRVGDFEMNKICAAGTGSFIEEQAKKLGISIDDYEKIALKGENPTNLGDRCTVFIESNISRALSQGESKEDITAGLSYSIVNNYLNRVVTNKPIGNRIFLQGGIAHNQAVVNAFRSVLGKDIVVPPFFSVTGAIGVAILTREKIENKAEKITDLNNITDVEKNKKTIY